MLNASRQNDSVIFYPDAVPDYIVSVDAGHGQTESQLFAVATGKFKTNGSPSMRARVNGDQLAGWEGEQHQLLWYEWGGAKYTTSLDALDIARKNIEHHSGVTRYGADIHRFFIAKSLAELGVKSGVIDLVVFCPPKYYKENLADILNVFEQAGPEYKIRGMNDKSDRVFTFARITVKPEGLVAGSALALDANGVMVKTDLLNSTVFVDLGAKTADTAEIFGGKLVGEGLDYSTFEHSGIREQILEPLRREIKEGKLHPFAAQLTVDDMERALRSWTSINQFIVEFAKQGVDLTANFQYWREKHAYHIATTIVEERYAGFSDVKNAVFMGGGYALNKETYDTWYNDKIVDIKKYPHLKKIDPLQWNREAGMRLALYRARMEGWVK